MQSYGILHLKRKENSMSSSDDYHRHRLRTATKCLKFRSSLFKGLAGRGAAAPERGLRSVRQSLTKKDSKKFT